MCPAVCGIAGKVLAEGEPDPALVERMCSAIRHRGPDSQGTFFGEGAGLGIQRLAIIDLNTGDQPITNEDSTVVVVLNGEIYNYRELRLDLERRGHRFATRSDTEVIVHLYEERGDECVHELRGMYAFALWDRPKRRLLIARDRLGKKPLVYSHRDGTLWFGSEAKSILQDSAVPRDADSVAVDAFLHFGYVPDPLTAFGAIRKLPPGHLLTWEDGSVQTRRYWQLSYTPKSRYRRREDAHEAIRETLLEATRLRMRSDVPLGAFLSGGVDSTAVVAAMAMQSSETVKTFSMGFDVESFDETVHAREVAQLFGTDHTELRLEPDAVAVLPRLVWHYGEPFADAAAIPSMYLAEAARHHVTVTLNGDGGDESFAGYDHHLSALVAGRLGWVPRPAGRLAASIADSLARSRPRMHAARRARWLAHATTLSEVERSAFGAAIFTGAERAALYSNDFEHDVQRHGGHADARLIDQVLDLSDSRSPLFLILYFGVNMELP
jgi:asparagine synthase (glutamine-hydrolysing)